MIIESYQIIPQMSFFTQLQIDVRKFYNWKCINCNKSCLATEQRKLPFANSNHELCENHDMYVELQVKLHIARWVKHYTMCKIAHSVKKLDSNNFLSCTLYTLQTKNGEIDAIGNQKFNE